jgi:hypothetical protein
VARRVDRKGRSKGGQPFLKLEKWIFQHPAFRALRPNARALLLELISRHNGRNNGAIGLGEREAAAALQLTDRGAVRRAFSELQERGFIVCTRRGGFNRKAGPNRASEWRLTFEPTPDGQPATKEFARMNADAPEHFSRGRNSTPAGRESNPGAAICPAKKANPGQECNPAPPEIRVFRGGNPVHI